MHQKYTIYPLFSHWVLRRSPEYTQIILPTICIVGYNRVEE
nr:MAG TPA: hypothetical protein [Caudoviricetes sp.]